MDASRFTERADLGLAWSVRDSFLQYIRSMPDGDIVWRLGAAVASTGEFFFPLASIDRERNAVRLAFSGEVRFLAHRGLLSVSVATLRVELEQSASAPGALVVAGASSPIATIDLTQSIEDGDVTMWLRRPVTLTEEGAALFGGSYAAGDEMAPITLRVPTLLLRG